MSGDFQDHSIGLPRAGLITYSRPSEEPLINPADEIERLRAELNKRDQALVAARDLLFPFFSVMKIIFEVERSGSSVAVPDREYWENWKANLRGKQADFIDALLNQGPSTAKQLKKLTRSGTSTVPQIIHKLKSLGLIEKNGSLYSLKKKP